MATRCNIFVKVRKEDIGKTFRIDLDKITGAESIKQKNQESNFGSITIRDDYIGIYSHWDGYPDGGVGLTLYKYYNSYDLALNLVLGGNVSSINGAYKPYVCMGADDCWEQESPEQKNEMPEPEEDYLYLFDCDQWWFKSDLDADWTSLRWYFESAYKKES